jgi:putative DNA methylase
VALTTFSDLVGEAREKVKADAERAFQELAIRTQDLGHSAVGGKKAAKSYVLDPKSLAEGGTGAEAYADAVATYLGLLLSRFSDRNNTICTWDSGPSGTKASTGGSARTASIRNAFSRQALPMSWDFAEAGVFSDSGGGFDSAMKWLAPTIEYAPASAPSVIQQVNAAGRIPQDGVVISSDPPYYDNIGYADLSDFFYVWARRSLKEVWPGNLQTVLVPKKDELVATPYRHEGKEAAERFFEEGIGLAIKNMRQASILDAPLAIYYAFKQSEAAKDGVSSTGWATFLQGVFDAGLVIDGTWPMRSELSNRMIASGTNALASSIVLVCRKRPADAPITTRAAFLAALKRELPAALKLLQAGNIAPVDLAQASIGPGMGIFTRHAKVLEADDTPMTVKTALQLINQALDDYLSEQESEYDAETRYAITWFDTHGMAAAGYGDAETLAKARNVSVSGVAEAGVLESKAGKVRLKKRSELPIDWNPLTDDRLTVWECAQHLIRVLEADGEAAAAALLARLGSRADATRDLAYRLYQICERKKWAEEARAYNGLVVAWPELQKLSQQQPSSAAPQEPAEADLI